MQKVNTKDVPIVSIACATYNHEPYIRQCLDSFVMQKTNFRFEAVVHDDASTDKTADIIREYEAKYPDLFKPIYQKTNGFGSERNAKMKQAAWHGKYIAFCEGDDYWTDPYKLQKQVDFLEANPDYAICGTAYTDSDGNKIYSNQQSFEVSTEALTGKNYYATLTILFRNLKSVKLYNSIKPVPLGDYYLYLFLHKYGKGYILSDETAFYRVHGNGSFSGANFIEKNEKLFITLKVFIKENSNYPFIRNLKRQALNNAINIIKYSKNKSIKKQAWIFTIQNFILLLVNKVNKIKKIIFK